METKDFYYDLPRRIDCTNAVGATGQFSFDGIG